MRCPECSKFAAYGEPQVEALDFGSDGETVTAEVQVTLVCAEDDTELKQGTLEASAEIEHTCDLGEVVVHLLKDTPPDQLGADDVDTAVADREFEVTDCTVTLTEVDYYVGDGPTNGGQKRHWVAFSPHVQTHCGLVVLRQREVIDG